MSSQSIPRNSRAILHGGTKHQRVDRPWLARWDPTESVRELIRCFAGTGSGNQARRGTNAGEKKAGPFLTIRSGHKSVCGGVRKRNEDRCFTDATAHLLMVADGMGGHRGGAQASSTMVQLGAEELLPVILQGRVNRLNLREEVAHCIQHARHTMVEWADTHPEDQHMGTTLALAMILGRKLYVSHVGDSRVYLFRKGFLRQLTLDETVAQAMCQAGALSQEEADRSPYRHCLLNAIGVRDLDHLPQVHAFPLTEGDRILLATDGLYDFVPPHIMRDLLESVACPQHVANRLVEVAAENESTDNVTAVVAEVVRTRGQTEPLSISDQLMLEAPYTATQGFAAVA